MPIVVGLLRPKNYGISGETVAARKNIEEVLKVLKHGPSTEREEVRSVNHISLQNDSTV